MDLSDGQLKRIVHFKLFVAVQGLSQSLEQRIQSSASFSSFPGAYSPPLKITGETIGTESKIETVLIVQVGCGG